jgi:hypothetical protein
MPEDIYEQFPILQQVEAAEAVIRTSVEKAHQNLPQPSNSGNMEHDIGAFLAQEVRVLEFIAKYLTDGEHLTASGKQLLDDMKKEHDLSESQSLDKLLERRSALRKMSKSIQGAAKEVRQIWDKAKDDSLTKPSSFETGSPMQDDCPSPRPKRSRRPSMSAGMEDVDLTTRTRGELKERGKGSYTCKFGRNCDKGGVHADGSLVTFERNSDFRSHLSKHHKPYRCNMQGCPNVKGFARQDQLKRHQSNVPHDVCHDKFAQLDWAIT